jgi:hypothetical protein
MMASRSASRPVVSMSRATYEVMDVHSSSKEEYRTSVS